LQLTDWAPGLFNSDIPDDARPIIIIYYSILSLVLSVDLLGGFFLSQKDACITSLGLTLDSRDVLIFKR
jgi:hypothetical protein